MDGEKSDGEKSEKSEKSDGEKLDVSDKSDKSEGEKSDNSYKPEGEKSLKPAAVAQKPEKSILPTLAYKQRKPCEPQYSLCLSLITKLKSPSQKVISDSLDALEYQFTHLQLFDTSFTLLLKLNELIAQLFCDYGEGVTAYREIVEVER